MCANCEKCEFAFSQKSQKSQFAQIDIARISVHNGEVSHPEKGLHINR